MNCKVILEAQEEGGFTVYVPALFLTARGGTTWYTIILTPRQRSPFPSIPR